MGFSLWLLLVVVAFAVLWGYSILFCFNYWNARGAPTVPDAVPLLGHYKLLSLQRCRWLYVDEVYRKHGGSRFCGLFEQHRPMLLVGDPKLVKAVLIRDFDHFVDRRHVPLNTENDIIFRELLNRLRGEEWKATRAMLSPLFTSGKLKGLYPLIEVKAEDLVAYIGKTMKHKLSLPLKRTFGFFSMEVITSCAFGVETSTFAEDGSIFSTNAEKMATFSFKDICKATLYRLAPWLCSSLGISLSSPELNFFVKVVQEVMRQRKSGQKRGDLLDLMMAARVEQSSSTSSTMEFILKESTIVATAVLFVVAGYDTISTTLSFVAHQLATHPKYQDRVRQELREIVRQHNGFTYEALMEAKLLDAFITETLRLYPPAVQKERRCTKDYTLPGTSVTVEEGTIVTVPTWSLHHDPLYWSNPEEFLLERFLPENKDKIVTGTYLPFGLGPRNCIGMRFALMEAKLALAKMLQKFELSHPPGKEQQPIHTLKFMKPPVDLSLTFTPLED